MYQHLRSLHTNRTSLLMTRILKICLKSGIPECSEGKLTSKYPSSYEASMESKRKEMVEEMKKRRLNVALIARNMNSTFALRRKELIEKEPAVKNTVERWPALFTHSQIMAEFNRISGKNLQAEFFQELDRFTPRFIDIFRAKGGDIGSKLKKILQQIENDKSNINAGRTAVLHGLPLLLGEDPSDFYKTCFDCDDNEDMSDVEIGILTVINPRALQLYTTPCILVPQHRQSFWKVQCLWMILKIFHKQRVCSWTNLCSKLRVSCSTEMHIRLHTKSDFVPWPQVTQILNPITEKSPDAVIDHSHDASLSE
ncbi:uncharacterized protein LOC113115044 isoform X1 [Carassius auratus]|uniref:Uncharacterized protein LOC113115044 isoform X1 n=2 Tax=Carassius auratus TaxID=7957 RepID=A0A6P6QXY4_CARAU|nr:uncharacterized protein LOC113115044 isoform X1 [Carassius auratus]